MLDSSSGFYLIVAILAMAICMVIIPQLIHWAPKLGMLDEPDPRKVHITPIPRVGGIGLVIGALVPIVIWLPFNVETISLLTGGVILLVFGAWDDIKELGPYVKFFGQFAAAIIVVYIGDTYIIHFPFIGLELLHESIGRPLTVFIIVGMINAINLSDGLDGLAGGESLLSLGAIIYLAFIFDQPQIIIIAAAVAGGIFGFLRFNSHPARVFMGDSGSQFIGYILVVLVIYLTQQTNSVTGPVLPFLLLGLPIMDTLAVLLIRIKNKTKVFEATNDHAHHRLLQVGFYHYEAVIIIYSTQILFVVTAALLPYETDMLIISIYLGVCFLLFSSITLAERCDIKVHTNVATKTTLLPPFFAQYENLSSLPYKIIEVGLSLFLIAAAIMSSDMPLDFGLSSVALLCLLLLTIISKWAGMYLYRLIMFVTIGFSVYLLSTYPPKWYVEEEIILYGYFILMSVSAFTCARLMIKEQFRMSPLDYLMIIMALIMGLLSDGGSESAVMIWMAIQIIILFYACELVIQKMDRSRLLTIPTISALIALTLISLRGLV